MFEYYLQETTPIERNRNDGRYFIIGYNEENFRCFPQIEDLSLRNKNENKNECLTHTSGIHMFVQGFFLS